MAEPLRSRSVVAAGVVIVLAAAGAGVYFGLIQDSDSTEEAESESQVSPADQAPQAFVPNEQELNTCLEGAGWNIEKSRFTSADHADAIVKTAPPRHATVLVSLWSDLGAARQDAREWRSIWRKQGQRHETFVEQIAGGWAAYVDAWVPLADAERAVLIRCIPELDL